MKNNKTILLVEDDKVDVMTVQRAFRDANISNKLAIVGNGEKALEYLRNKFNEKPGIIILDLNMPLMTGIEFLREIRNDNEAIRNIPTLVLTTSDNEQEKDECLQLGIAAYMVKPVDYWQFVDMVKTFDNYLDINGLS